MTDRTSPSADAAAGADFDRLLEAAHTLRRTGPRGRYAPSPTGALHLGNLRTALLAWLQARLAGGSFILRIEDLDRARSRPGLDAQMLADLRWLGLDWDEGPDCGGPAAPYVQSQRDAFYRAAFERLRATGRLFPCVCSRKDIALAASAPHRQDGAALYPGTCRTRSAARINTGAHCAWRYRVGDDWVTFDDEVAGRVVQHMQREVGDFVLRRADDVYAYQLAVVVDDALMGVSDVLRGADLLDSTPRQIELLRALGLPEPRHWHVPLLLDAEGRRLAKRDDAAGVAALRATGVTPARLVGRYARELGLIEHDEPMSARELLSGLTPTGFRAALRNAHAAAPG